MEAAPAAVRDLLRRGVRGEVQETPKPSSPLFSSVHNILVGSNVEPCQAAVKRLRSMGYRTRLLSTRVEGEARRVGEEMARTAASMARSGKLPSATAAAAVAGGETTVKVKGRGMGGRNQELVLAASLGIRGLKGVTILSVVTDGVDGPTDAAGAIADWTTTKRARAKRMDASRYLANNDSYRFFKRLGDTIVTGPTGTNVNDIMMIIFDPADAL